MDDTKELLLALIENAKTGKYTKIEELRFFSDYVGGFITYQAIKKVIHTLEKAANNLFKNYCRDIQYQQANINTLLAYKQLRYTIAFYKEEQIILKEALAVYEDWLFDGNFLIAFLFGEEKCD